MYPGSTHPRSVFDAGRCSGWCSCNWPDVNRLVASVGDVLPYDVLSRNLQGWFFLVSNIRESDLDPINL